MLYLTHNKLILREFHMDHATLICLKKHAVLQIAICQQGCRATAGVGRQQSPPLVNNLALAPSTQVSKIAKSHRILPNLGNFE